MITKIMWFMLHRWYFISLSKKLGGSKHLPQACFKNNMAGCAKHGAIIRDIIKINRKAQL